MRGGELRQVHRKEVDLSPENPQQSSKPRAILWGLNMLNNFLGILWYCSKSGLKLKRIFITDVRIQIPYLFRRAQQGSKQVCDTE